MNLSTIAQSMNVIDLRSMIHLMPDQLQSQLNGAEMQGIWAGATIAFGVALLMNLAITILGKWS